MRTTSLKVPAACRAIMLLVAGAAPMLLPGSVSSQSSYTWHNVRIVAGGFVPGIVYHPNVQNLVYARTDIGGLYKSTDGGINWAPLLAWVNWSNWGYPGLPSAGLDPQNAKPIYPAPTGNQTSTFGLWKTANAGPSWSQVTSFTASGEWQDDPTDATGYQSQKQGISWVVFDPRVVVNGITQNIYVGIASKTVPTIYRSTDGGNTWSALAGQPLTDCGGDGIMPTKAAIDPTTGTMYVTYGEKAGPYDDEKGDGYTYNTGTGAWTNITPVTNACMPPGSSTIYFAFNGPYSSNSN